MDNTTTFYAFIITLAIYAFFAIQKRRNKKSIKEQEENEKTISKILRFGEVATFIALILQVCVFLATRVTGCSNDSQPTPETTPTAIVETTPEPTLEPTAEPTPTLEPTKKPKKTVWLSSLDYFAQDGFFYTTNTIKDNLGKEYINVFYANESVFSKKHTRTIILNDEYKKITGRVIVDYEDRNREYVGSVAIYGDGDKIFESGDMGAKVKPVDINESLTGIHELEIVVYSYSAGWAGYNPYIVDAILYKK